MEWSEAVLVGFMQVGALAELVLESKVTCDAAGEYAYGCGHTWAGATSFAGAAYEAFASAFAETGTAAECNCDVDITANADAVVAGAPCVHHFFSIICSNRAACTRSICMRCKHVL